MTSGNRVGWGREGSGREVSRRTLAAWGALALLLGAGSLRAGEPVRLGMTETDVTNKLGSADEVMEAENIYFAGVTGRVLSFRPAEGAALPDGVERVVVTVVSNRTESIIYEKSAALTEAFVTATMEANKQGSTWEKGTQEQMKKVDSNLSPLRVLDGVWYRKDGKGFVVYTHDRSGGKYRFEVMTEHLAASARKRLER
jgi:hypothetical protein